jgi:kynurenine formamidase
MKRILLAVLNSFINAIVRCGRTASGHDETSDTDPGIATSKDDYLLETYILSTNHYQIELLTNLGSSSRGWRHRRNQFPKTKERLGVSSASIAIVP